MYLCEIKESWKWEIFIFFISFSYFIAYHHTYFHLSHFTSFTRNKKIKLWARREGGVEVEWWWKSLPWHLEWCGANDEEKGFNILSSSLSSSSKWLIDESFWHGKRREREARRIGIKIYEMFSILKWEHFFDHKICKWKMNFRYFYKIPYSTLFEEFY